MRKGVLSLSLALFLLLSAWLLSGFVASTQQTADDEDIVRQYEDAKARLEALQERSEALEVNQQDLQRQADELLELLKNPSKNPDLVEEWSTMALLAGLRPVSGPGLEIILNDKLDYNPLVDPVLSLIHDQTVNHVLTLLADNGAVALSLNGIRITAVAQIYCIGPTILCYNTRLTPPYRILALGPADQLASALLEDPTVQRLTAPAIGVRLQLAEATDLLVPSYAEHGDYSKLISLLEVIHP